MSADQDFRERIEQAVHAAQDAVKAQWRPAAAATMIGMMTTAMVAMDGDLSKKRAVWVFASAALLILLFWFIRDWQGPKRLLALVLELKSENDALRGKIVKLEALVGEVRRDFADLRARLSRLSTSYSQSDSALESERLRIERLGTSYREVAAELERSHATISAVQSAHDAVAGELESVRAAAVRREASDAEAMARVRQVVGNLTARVRKLEARHFIYHGTVCSYEIRDAAGQDVEVRKTVDLQALESVDRISETGISVNNAPEETVDLGLVDLGQASEYPKTIETAIALEGRVMLAIAMAKHLGNDIFQRSLSTPLNLDHVYRKIVRCSCKPGALSGDFEYIDIRNTAPGPVWIRVKAVKAYPMFNLRLVRIPLSGPIEYEEHSPIQNGATKSFDRIIESLRPSDRLRLEWCRREKCEQSAVDALTSSADQQSQARRHTPVEVKAEISRSPTRA